jgi:hypothetical protein
VRAFAITFGPGPGWDPALPRREQRDWDAHAVRARFAADPWEPLGILRIERVDPWSLWLDARKSRPAD